MIGAVDIGGTKIAVGMVNSDGKVLARRECALQRLIAATPDALRRIVEMLRAIAETADTQISGVGIGCTGPVYPLTGEIGEVNFFPHWKGENPVRDLGRILQTGVAMENDADAAALGEAGWGAGRRRSRFIYVTVGTGIGAGIVLDGQLYRGVDHSHPEIGHHIIDPSGPALRLRLSRLLGVTGRRSGYGCMAREKCSARIYPGGRSDREEDLRTGAAR